MRAILLLLLAMPLVWIPLAGAPRTAWAQDDEDDEDFTDLLEEAARGADSISVGGKGGSSSKENAERVNRMVELYLRMYGKHLSSQDWIKRALAVISLGRISDPRTTDKLLAVLEDDSLRDFKYVRTYAWEYLHARNHLLTDEQRRRWINGGLILATEHRTIRGRLRGGFLRAIAPEGPTERNKQIFREYFQQSNLFYGPDRILAEALRDTLGVWKDPDLAKELIDKLSDPNDCYRAEFVLRGLQSGRRTADDLHATGKPLLEEWKALQGEYSAWFAGANLTPATADQIKPYAGASQLLDKPVVIDDPDDPRWRRDLELPNLLVSQLAVTIAMDSTGSMGKAIEWIKGDVARLLRALKLISREPSLGVTLYRDRDEKYVVRMYSMTDSGKKLAEALKNADAAGGGDYPEAVYTALQAVIHKQRWPSGAAARRVVVLVGDAPPHRDDMGSLQAMLEQAAKDGFRVHCLKVPNPDFEKASRSAVEYGGEAPLNPFHAFDDIARWGEGASVTVDFDSTGPVVMYASMPVPYAYSGGGTAHRKLLAAILMGLVDKAYHDRLDPFAQLLVECIEKSPPEEHEYKMPKKRVHNPGSHEHRKHKRPPRYDQP